MENNWQKTKNIEMFREALDKEYPSDKKYLLSGVVGIIIWLSLLWIFTG